MLAGNSPYTVSDYDLLQTEVLTGSQASVTFSSLGDYASSYRHFQIRAVARMTFANAERTLNVRVNGDSTSSYRNHGLYSQGSTPLGFNYAGTSIGAASFAAANAASGSFGAAVIDILDPFETTKYTTVRGFGGADTTPQVSLRSGFWPNSNIVTSLTLVDPTSDLVAGSRFSLYGLRGA